ncbi:MAG: hypothetical protein ACXVXB_14465 [Nocardioidaceae bacterium]
MWATRPERSGARLPAAAAAVVGAAAHVPVTEDHLRQAPYIGVLFIGLEIALVVIAVLLLVRDSALVWTAAAVVPALAVVSYVVSRTIGLPQIGDDVGNWTEPLGVVSVVSETLMVVLALGHRSRVAGGRGRLAPAVVATVLLVGGMGATARAASAEPHMGTGSGGSMQGHGLPALHDGSTPR